MPLFALLIFLGILLSTACPALSVRGEEADPISITHTANFQFEPAAITLAIRIAPHEDNREVCVNTEGTNGYSRTSCFPHVGLNTNSQVRIVHRNLKGARYYVRAVLGRFQEGKEELDFHFAKDDFCILSRMKENSCD